MDYHDDQAGANLYASFKEALIDCDYWEIPAFRKGEITLSVVRNRYSNAIECTLLGLDAGSTIGEIE